MPVSKDKNRLTISIDKKSYDHVSLMAGGRIAGKSQYINKLIIEDYERSELMDSKNIGDLIAEHVAQVNEQIDSKCIELLEELDVSIPRFESGLIDSEQLNLIIYNKNIELIVEHNQMDVFIKINQDGKLVKEYTIEKVFEYVANP